MRNFLEEFDVEKENTSQEIFVNDYDAFENKELLDELRNKIIQNLIDNNVLHHGSMDDFIHDVKVDIKRTFDNEDFEKEKTLIRQEYEQKRTELLEKLNEKTMQYGFQVKTAENGIYMMPVLNGNTINEEEFEKLDEELKKDFVSEGLPTGVKDNLQPTNVAATVAEYRSGWGNITNRNQTDKIDKEDPVHFAVAWQNRE